IRRWSLQSCATGVRQVLMLGAGFDGLSLTLLAQVPALRIFEIERERTIAVKRSALRSLQAHDPRLALVAADLSAAPIESLLRALPSFDPERPTLVIAEGVLMYLGVSELRR